MGLTIIGATTHRRGHARRFIWIQEVRVKGYREAVSAFCDNRQGFIHDRADSTPIDLFHGEDTMAGLFDKLSLAGIDYADSYLNGIVRLNFWRKSENVCQFDRTVSHDRGH